jgi:glycosyltransferase involved in cell wall biosynthesis
LVIDSMGLRSPTLDLRAALVSTYPPDRCGIGRFSWSLSTAMRRLPGVSVDIVRLVGPGDISSKVPDVVMELDPRSPVAVRSAARRLGRADVAIVQHEFGIYGPDDGAAVVDLVSALDIPAIVVLHTVLRDPSLNQRAITRALAASADGLVALSGSAEDLLVNRYGIDPALVTMIPHGSSWAPQPVTPRPRRNLLTWGLLGPGKGIERAISAVADLDIPGPNAVYRIVGQIHPSVLRRSGPAYRTHLEELVADNGLGDGVRFDDRYQDEAGLLRAVAAADVVILPYDNKEQISSGVLIVAGAAGRPVVATAFPHAIELLGGGAGIIVDHDDPAAMTEAIATLLTDELAYRRTADCAAELGKKLGWDAIAGRYTKLLSGLVATAGIVA